MTVARIWTSAGWMDLNGAPGLPGPQGPPGGPVPVGGTTDQVLAKASNTDGHVKWVDAGGGAAAVWIDEEAPSDPNANLWIDTDEPGVDLQDWAGLDTRVETLETYQPQYVTSLPATPYAGQEVFYRPVVDQGVWHLRYTEGWGDGYGWEFVGGAPLVSFVAAGSGQQTSTSYIDVPGDLPLTLPLAGIYDVYVESWLSGNVATYCFYTPKFGAAATSDGDAIQWWTNAGNIAQPISRKFRKTIATAGSIIKMQCRVGGGYMTSSNRSLYVTPVRVK